MSGVLIALTMCLLASWQVYAFNVPRKIGFGVKLRSGAMVQSGASEVNSLWRSSQRLGSGLCMSENAADDNSNEADGKFDPAAWVNPNTRGGVIVWSLILITIPYLVYVYLVSTGLEATKVGAYVGALFVLLSNVLWASTYIFRVANKDMTYAKQLRDYENAVLQKRLEELDDDEIDALLEEIEDEGDSPGGDE